MTADHHVFSPVVVAALIAVGMLSFVGAILITTYGEDSRQATTVDANAYSRSAIGHRAFVDLLHRLDIPAHVSRYDSANKALYQDILMVLEPDANKAAVEGLLEADEILVVLPKWRGGRSLENPLWLGSMSRMSEERVNNTIEHFGIDAKIVRPEEEIAWQMADGFPAPDLPDPQLLTSESEDFTPLLTSDKGVLAGVVYRDEQTIWLVSDPDIFSNHGLGRGDNAITAIRIMEWIRGDGGRGIVIDETIHGFQLDPSLIRRALQFPFVLASLLGLLTIGILGWASSGRFGAPEPGKQDIAPGKAVLIDNTAGLLEFGEHTKEVLRRYLADATQEVAEAVHAPKKLYSRALIDWLDRVGRGKGQIIPAKTIYNRAEVAARSDYADRDTLLKVAQDIYQWKKEMLHGPRGRPGNQS